jgi:PAS domain S-box-containing protein
MKYGEVSRSPMIRDGKIIGLIAVGRDITERKRAENALRKSEEQLRLVTENMADLVLEMDNQGRFRYFTPNVTRLLGFQPEKLLGKRAFDFVHPDERAAASNAFMEAIETGHGTVEARILRQDGHYTWMDLIGRTFYTDKGEAEGIIMVGRDIAAK